MLRLAEFLKSIILSCFWSPDIQLKSVTELAEMFPIKSSDAISFQDALDGIS